MTSDEIRGGSGMTGAQVLALPLEEDAPVSGTIADYFQELLLKLLEEDGFSGKRALGDSGWIYDLYRPLMTAGLIDGTYDDFEGFMDVDEEEADRLLALAVRAL